MSSNVFLFRGPKLVFLYSSIPVHLLCISFALAATCGLVSWSLVGTVRARWNFLLYLHYHTTFVVMFWVLSWLCTTGLLFTGMFSAEACVHQAQFSFQFCCARVMVLSFVRFSRTGGSLHCHASTALAGLQILLFIILYPYSLVWWSSKIVHDIWNVKSFISCNSQ